MDRHKDEIRGPSTSLVCDMTHSCVWHDSFVCVTWLILVCDMTHSCVQHDAFVCVIILVCDMTHSCVRHDSLVCVCISNSLVVCVTQKTRRQTRCTHKYPWLSLWLSLWTYSHLPLDPHPWNPQPSNTRTHTPESWSGFSNLVKFEQIELQVEAFRLFDYGVITALLWSSSVSFWSNNISLCHYGVMTATP